MQIRLSDYLKANRRRTLYEINKAENSKLTVSLVLNTDIGEFYWQPSSLISGIPESDYLIHKCDSYPTPRNDEYLERLIEKIGRTDKMINVEVISDNFKRAKLIYAYEEMTDAHYRLVKRSVEPLYTSIRFEPTVRQSEINERYKEAIEYLLGNQNTNVPSDVKMEAENIMGTMEPPPKQVTYDDSNDCVCPNCGEFLTTATGRIYEEHSEHNYCSKCGQRLLWE